ncbi:MAG: hypothetical protein KDJ16_08100 [Hyphomicrobiales bacterium]|nr:hypothetical protein [Hyphomicrobiales bacterium]
MTRSKTVVSALVAGLALVSPATALVLEDEFGNFDACYERAYEIGHLTAHPDQKVARMRLEHFPARFGAIGDDGKIRYEPENLYLRIEVVLRDSWRQYENFALCERKADKIDCYIECDGGGFSITAGRSGSILLHNRGIAIIGCDSPDEMAEENVTYLEPEPDDKVFRLDRARRCTPPPDTDGAQ